MNDLRYKLRSEANGHWLRTALGKERAFLVADTVCDVYEAAQASGDSSKETILRNTKAALKSKVGFPWLTLALFLANILIQYIMRRRENKK